MIDSIEMRSLRNAEFLQIVKDLSEIIQSNGPAVLNVVPQQVAFKASVAAVAALFKTEKSSPLTDEVHVWDLRRDRSVNGLTTVVEGYTYYFQPEKAEAARLLSDNLKLYGPGLARQNYQAETALISEMMEDWENKPELVAAITLLGLVDWKDELYFANNKFNEVWLNRSREYAAASPDTIKEKRDETVAAFNELKKFLEAYATINSTVPVYQKTINELNAVIDQYNTILIERAASGGEENGNGEPGTGEGEEITPQPL